MHFQKLFLLNADAALQDISPLTTTPPATKCTSVGREKSRATVKSAAKKRVCVLFGVIFPAHILARGQREGTPKRGSAGKTVPIR
jgi:hypothetical protein